jgi:O-antigen ligase
VERYPNWQNLGVMGYPQNATGEVVKGNTYERLAWAVAGFQILLPQNPLGLGVLKKPFYIALKEKYPNSSENHSGTHSAWVDLALAFGYPGLTLLLGALLATAYLSICSRSPFRSLGGLLSIGLILLYTVGEISSQHSIEILCFLISLISALLLLPQELDVGDQSPAAKQDEV